MSEGEVSADVSGGETPDSGTDKTDKIEEVDSVPTEPAKDPKEPKKKAPPPAPQAPKMRKVIVDGVEEEVDEEETFRNYQKYRAGDKLLKEAAAQKKQVAEFLKALKENPEKVLSDPRLNIDLAKIARSKLEKEIETELRDPRDVELEQLREINKTREEKDLAEKTEREAQDWEVNVSTQREAIAGQLHEVLGSSVLAKDAMTLRAAAYYMRQCLAKGIEVTPQEIVEHLEHSQMGNYRATALQYEGDQLVNYLGPDIVKKIRAYDLAQLRKSRGEANPERERVEAPASNEKQPEHYFDRYSASAMARKKLGI